MHAEICPVCKGRGKICKNYPSGPPCKEEVMCWGCGGKGWIEVSDDGFRYVYPIIKWYPENFETDKTTYSFVFPEVRIK